MSATIRQERGAVLLVVILLVALFASFMAEFAFSTLVETRLTETFRDGTRAYYLARGGVMAGRAILQDDANNYDALTEFWAQGINSYPVAEGDVSIFIDDLGGKIDVNRLVTPEGNVNVVIKDRLLRLFEMMEGDGDPSSLVDALVDWLDGDDDPLPGGGEDPYYMGLAKPYHCKNAALDTLDELNLVKGFSEDLLRQSKGFLTVHGGEKINVNTASAEVLASLADEMTVEDARYLCEIRAEKPFREVVEIRDLPGFDSLYWAVASHLTVTSPNYRIVSKARVNSGVRTAEAVYAKAEGRLMSFKVY